ncbi:MAG: hypothetical protein GF329_14615 [Candidatus Lokiarchaeota archaeon]|nr:hypothetical protein [Candidatus Lokiarchaeota archaeon]
MSDKLNEKLDKIEKTKEVRSLVIKALGAYKRGNLDESAMYYEKAAKISEKLGHDDLARAYRKKSKGMKDKDKKIEKKLDEKEKQSIDMLKEADELIEKGKFGKAAEIFEEAASIAPQDRAIEYKREANELFKKEKEMQILKENVKRKTESKDQYLGTLDMVKSSVKEGKIDNAIHYIEKAIAIAKELGKDEEVEQLRSQAKELKKRQIKEKEEEKEYKKKRGYSERGEIVEVYTETLSKLKNALSAKDYQKAFDLYIEAANLALQMGEPDRAELFRTKAEELKEEVVKQQEITKLNKRRKELKDKIDKLDEKKNTDELILYYTELIGALAELGETENIKKYDKKIEKLKLISERSKLEKEAKEAADEKNFERALSLFRKAAKISVELNDETNYSDKIQELKEKSEKVTSQRNLIDKRSVAVANAKRLLEENKYEEAVEQYNIAAKNSDELGDKEIAQSYRETARRLDKDREIITEKEKFIRDAEKAIKEKNYQLASDYFNQAAKFCEKISEIEEAEKFKKKAEIILELSKIE